MKLEAESNEHGKNYIEQKPMYTDFKKSITMPFEVTKKQIHEKY